MVYSSFSLMELRFIELNVILLELEIVLPISKNTLN